MLKGRQEDEDVLSAVCGPPETRTLKSETSRSCSHP